jgi:hypothetical protein
MNCIMQPVLLLLEGKMKPNVPEDAADLRHRALRMPDLKRGKERGFGT